MPGFSVAWLGGLGNPGFWVYPSFTQSPGSLHCGILSCHRAHLFFKSEIRLASRPTGLRICSPSAASIEQDPTATGHGLPRPGRAGPDCPSDRGDPSPAREPCRCRNAVKLVTALWPKLAIDIRWLLLVNGAGSSSPERVCK